MLAIAPKMVIEQALAVSVGRASSWQHEHLATAYLSIDRRKYW